MKNKSALHFTKNEYFDLTKKKISSENHDRINGKLIKISKKRQFGQIISEQNQDKEIETKRRILTDESKKKYTEIDQRVETLTK